MKYLSAMLLCSAALLSFSSLTSFAQSVSRETILEDIQAKRADLRNLEAQFLAPSAEDRAAWAEFLQQPDTGLVRLLPREKYDSEVYKNRKTLTMRGGGAYYSFTRLTHEYGPTSDISLDSNYLSVGFAGANYGMLLPLGDLPLEKITFDYPAAQFISTYTPPQLESDVRVEQRRFANGATIDERLYRTRVPVEINSTLLLRSISFGATDVLVAIKIARKDSDGSVIVAWKLLKKYAKPILARNN